MIRANKYRTLAGCSWPFGLQPPMPQTSLTGLWKIMCDRLMLLAHVLVIALINKLVHEMNRVDPFFGSHTGLPSGRGCISLRDLWQFFRGKLVFLIRPPKRLSRTSIHLEIPIRDKRIDRSNNGFYCLIRLPKLAIGIQNLRIGGIQKAFLAPD